MTITYSDYILQGGHAVKNIQTLRELGAQGVELLMDGTCWDDADGGWDLLAPSLRNSGLRLSLHPPSCDTNLTAEMEALRTASFTLYHNTLRLAARIGARSVVLHPGFCYAPKFDKQQAKERAYRAVLRLTEEARNLGVRLLVENVGFGHASLYSQAEFARLLDGVDPIAGYLIDTGHAHINGWDIAELIRAVAPRVYGFHIHDNDRSRDAHLAIGRGTIAWEAVFEAMRLVAQDCDFIFEYSPAAQLHELEQGRGILAGALGIS